MKISKHLVDSMTGRLTEPKPTGQPVVKIDLVQMLNFYAANHKSSQKKEWALDYAETVAELNDVLPKLKKVNDGFFETWGSIARLITKGHQIEPSLHERLNARLVALSESVVEEKEEKVKIESWVPQFDTPASMFDSAVDSVMAGEEVTFDAASIKPKQIQEESKKLLDGIDDMRPIAARRLKKWLSTIVSRVLEVASKKKTRVTRVRKVSPEKMTKNVSYGTRHEAINFTLLHPSEVIGRKKMYLFNSKYRKLICMQAQATGFAFKGTTLQGYDADRSTSKTLRNPETFFSGYTSQPSISELNKRFKEINAKAKPVTTGRFNENILILGVS